MDSKLIFKTGNGIIQRGYGIISPTSRPLIKTSFPRCFSFDPRASKLVFEIVNRIIQTGNEIISPTSRPLIKKFLLQNVSHLIQGVLNQFSKRERELSKQEMELFLPLLDL